MSRRISLQGVTNVRDLGGLTAGNGRKIAPGLMYRGGALSNATLEDAKILFEKLGIGTVVDVRCGWEREAKPDIEWPNINNIHIPFYDLDIVGIEYTQPAPGTVPYGRDVACEPDHYYRSLSNKLTVGQMRKAVAAVFDRVLKGEAVYEHCSGGKDRAGILALLILSVLGVEREAILQDYLITNDSRDRHYDEMFNRFLKFAQGDESRARELTLAHRARPENLNAFYEAIEQAYGDMNSFIREQLGISDEQRQEICAYCTA